MITKTLDRIKSMRRIPSESYTAFKQRLEAELDYLRSKKCREWEADEQLTKQKSITHNAGAYERGSNGWEVVERGQNKVFNRKKGA